MQQDEEKVSVEAEGEEEEEEGMRSERASHLNDIASNKSDGRVGLERAVVAHAVVHRDAGGERNAYEDQKRCGGVE